MTFARCCRLRKKYGSDWAAIGTELGRSPSSVKDRCRLLKDSCNSGKLCQRRDVMSSHERISFNVFFWEWLAYKLYVQKSNIILNFVLFLGLLTQGSGLLKRRSDSLTRYSDSRESCQVGAL